MCCEKLYDFKLFLVDPVLFSTACLAHTEEGYKKERFFCPQSAVPLGFVFGYNRVC